MKLADLEDNKERMSKLDMLAFDKLKITMGDRYGNNVLNLIDMLPRVLMSNFDLHKVFLQVVDNTVGETDDGEEFGKKKGYRYSVFYAGSISSNYRLMEQNGDRLLPLLINILKKTSCMHGYSPNLTIYYMKEVGTFTECALYYPNDMSYKEIKTVEDAVKVTGDRIEAIENKKVDAFQKLSVIAKALKMKCHDRNSDVSWARLCGFSPVFARKQLEKGYRSNVVVKVVEASMPMEFMFEYVGVAEYFGLQFFNLWKQMLSESKMFMAEEPIYVDDTTTPETPSIHMKYNMFNN